MATKLQHNYVLLFFYDLGSGSTCNVILLVAVGN